MGKLNKIYCIGDSHVSVFLGKDSLAPIYPAKSNSLFDFFEVVRIGPITAYNIGNANSTTRAKEKIDSLIKAEVPAGSTLIFSAGEIDIRVHLLKQATLQNKTSYEISSEILEKYMLVLKGYANLGFNIIVLSPPPSTYILENLSEYPTYGTEKDRNIATKIFNENLKIQTQKNQFQLIDIFTKYIDSDYLTKQKSLWDGIHPSSYVLQDIINQLNRNLNPKLKIPVSWQLREFFRKLKSSFLTRLSR